MIIVRPQDPHLSLFSATVIVASVWLVSIVIADTLTIIISVIITFVWFCDDNGRYDGESHLEDQSFPFRHFHNQNYQNDNHHNHVR